MSQRQRAGSPALQAGLSLVETMVGLTLGLVVALVMTQVWSSFEGQKQRSVSGSTAQESGLLALTQIDHDGRNAGANLTNPSALECTTVYSFYDNGVSTVSPVPAYSGATPTAAVQITSGGATGSDTILFRRGEALEGGAPITLQVNVSSTSSVFDVTNTAPFSDNDLVMLMGPTGDCTLIQVTSVLTGSSKLQHNPGGTPSWNPSNPFRTGNGWPAYNAGSKVMKVGRVEMRTYSIVNNELRVLDQTDPITSTTTTLAYDIVRLKAQYGIAPTGSQDVTQWVNATAATGWNTLDADKIKRIKAVRVAVVARSAKLETANVTNTCVNNAGTNNGPCLWADTAASPAPLIDLSGDTRWRRYRYRVYETIIPLRNVIWANV